MSQPATNFAVSIAVAKQMPCAGRIIAVFTPMTSPREFTSGPPELPGLSAASVWITSSIKRPDCARSERPSALTTPAVTVAWKPNGLPIAIASCPDRACDTIDLVAATVCSAGRIVEYTIFGEDLVDGRAPTHRV